MLMLPLLPPMMSRCVGLDCFSTAVTVNFKSISSIVNSFYILLTSLSLSHSPALSYLALGSSESASLGHTLDVMGNEIHSLQATNTANAETESIYLEVGNTHD
jgi:hypothetical protein